MNSIYWILINLTFDNNVTKSLFWYNSKPHSSVWNFTFSAYKPSVLDFKGSPQSSISPQDTGSVTAPLLVPKSVPWGTQVFINLSHFWEGIDCIDAMLGSLCPLRLELGHCNKTKREKKKKKLFPWAWANKLHISKCFRGLLKILPLACWKTRRKTESFLPLLVQYVYRYVVWNIYIYIYCSSACVSMYPFQ